jgi:(R,R)-butanediol dehydrogenase/meso-butanediol dehydrogenase/diacetyl reductase
MRAAVTDDAGHVVVQEREVGRPGDDQLLIKVDASGICGSDLHALEAFGAGMVLGHEFTGVITQIGSAVRGFTLGDRVCALPAHSCGQCARCLAGDPIRCPQAAYLGTPVADGAFADYIVVDAGAAVLIPPHVTREQAALVEPMAIGLKVFERGRPAPNDVLLIMGAGPIGLAVVLWARAGGVGRIVVSDPVQSRRELARSLGATHAVDPTTQDLPRYFETHFGAVPQVVIECAGKPGTFDQAATVVGYEGKIVIAGMHMEPEEFGRLQPFIKNVTASFCCWYTKAHYAHTVHMIAEGRIDPVAMVTHRICLEELSAALTALKTPNDYGKILVLAD